MSADRLFEVLADPTRRGIVEKLGAVPVSVSDLARDNGIGLPSAVKHLQALEAAGIVTTEKVGRVRQVMLAPEALRPLGDWLSARERATVRALDRLAAAMLRFSGDGGK